MAFAVLPMGAVILRQPPLYDEERHLLFIYPTLVAGAVLGLERLDTRLKACLVVVILVGTLHAYWQWGRFGYVYRSPLIGNGANRFMGDYWGVCLAEVSTRLAGIVTEPTEVVVDGPISIMRWHAQRVRTRLPNVALITLTDDDVHRPGKLRVNISRAGWHEWVEQDIADGKADLLFRITMPGDETACVVARYK
jgi:hypothetical protein